MLCRSLPKFLLALVIFDAAVRLVFLGLGTPPLVKDPVDYWRIGAAVADGDWLVRSHPIAFRTPGYPLLLAAFQYVLGRHALIGVTVFQHVLGLAANLMAASLVFSLTRSRVAAAATYGILVGALASVYGNNFVMTEPTYRFLATLLAVLALGYGDRPTTSRVLAIGLTIGAMTLVRPVAQFLCVPIGALLWFAWRRQSPPGPRWSTRVAHALVPALLTVALALPWVARNQALFGEPFLTKFAGRSFWRAAFFEFSRDLPFPETVEMERVLAAAKLDRDDPGLRHNWGVYALLRRDGLSEIEAEDLMVAVARQAISANAGTYVGGIPRALAVFAAARSFDIRPQTDMTEGEYFGQSRLWFPSLQRAFEDHGPPSWTESRVVNGIVAVASLLGLSFGMAFPRTRWIALALLAIIAYHAAISVIAEFPSYRYRSVLEPLIAVGVGMLALSRRTVPENEA